MKKIKKRYIILPAVLFLLLGYGFFFSAPVSFWQHYRGKHTDNIKFSFSEGGWYYDHLFPASFAAEAAENDLPGFSAGSVDIYRCQADSSRSDGDHNDVTRTNGHRVLVHYNNQTGQTLCNMECRVQQWLDGRWYYILTDEQQFPVPTIHPEGPAVESAPVYNNSHPSLFYGADDRLNIVHSGKPFYGLFRVEVVYQKEVPGEKYLTYSDLFFILPGVDYPEWNEDLQPRHS